MHSYAPLLFGRMLIFDEMMSKSINVD
jgi:hypothetical protein